jgi:benzoyl-CoA reductase subunit C
VPQNYANGVGGNYYVQELQELRKGLERIAARPITDDDIRRSIAIYNENRRAVRAVYDFRARSPWRAPSPDVYLLMRAGMVLPVEAHTQLLYDYLRQAEAENQPLRDNCRIVLTGAFCEQPPLNLIRSIERAGCYIVDDDFMLVTRWLVDDVAEAGDPIADLAHAFLTQSTETSAHYEPDGARKGQYLVETVRARNAEGVIFAAPSFCDPALLERPMLQRRLTDAAIPYIAFKYAENSAQMQPIREQAGTFADSIKLWSAP